MLRGVLRICGCCIVVVLRCSGVVLCCGVVVCVLEGLCCVGLVGLVVSIFRIVLRCVLGFLLGI